MTTTSDQDPISRYLADMEAGRPMSDDVLDAAVTFDATVPNWRFRRLGADEVRAELSGWYHHPGHLEGVRRIPVPGGETVEVDLTWVEDGIPFAAHQLHVLEHDGERITAITAFCGGRWPAALLAEMEAAGAST